MHGCYQGVPQQPGSRNRESLGDLRRELNNQGLAPQLMFPPKDGDFEAGSGLRLIGSRRWGLRTKCPCIDELLAVQLAMPVIGKMVNNQNGQRGEV